MKRMLLTIALVLGLAGGVSHAASVTLAWDASTSADVIGYRVYYGNEKRPATAGTVSQYQYPYSTNAGNVKTYTIDNLGPGLWAFTVTAFNSVTESAYSNEVDTTITAYVPPVPVTHPPIVVPVGPKTVTITTHVDVQ